MSKDLFSKWDKMVDMEGLSEIVEGSEGGNYKEVPAGKYEVKVEKIELTESKSGLPMVTIWFKIISEGEYKGSLIFMNQVITNTGFIGKVLSILKGLTSECENAPELKYVNIEQFNTLLLDVAEVIDNKFEYALDYSQDKKGYGIFKIEEVFVLD